VQTARPAREHKDVFSRAIKRRYRFDTPTGRGVPKGNAFSAIAMLRISFAWRLVFSARPSAFITANTDFSVGLPSLPKDR
jgi:hypothetical protein